jgi:hypothetical protein
MPSHKKDKFLAEVLSYIKFPFDRDDIRSELDSHILDKIDYYIEQGHDKEKAEQLSINDMGEAKEIGMELNKQHNPFLGWVWKITNVMVILFVIVNIYIVGTPILMSLFDRNPMNEIPKSNIVYKIDIDEKVKLDDAVIHFTNVVYEKNGDMNILYEYYDTKLWGTGWSFGGTGNITDNLGNTYFDGSGGGGGGIKSKYIRTIENFAKEADTLIISYDSFNRKYRVEIPLQVGDSNE